MERLYLTIPLEDFNQKQLAIKKEGERLITEFGKEEVRTFSFLTGKAQIWKVNSERVFEDSFNIPKNRYFNLLNSGNPNYIKSYDFRNLEPDKAVKKIKERLHHLDYVNQLIGVSEALVNPDKEIDEELSPTEFIELIKHKLFKLYKSNFYFSIKELLAGEGIEIKRAGFEEELAEILESDNYIEVNDVGDLSIKLSAKGYIKIQTEIEKLTTPKALKQDNIMNKKIFIVHGHDKIARLELEKMLSSDFKLEPVILEEQPSDQLETILSKLDKHARNCAAAIILYTADDIAENESRARQNVLLELGYFLGYFSLENRRVILLKKQGVNIPSDLHGVIYVQFNDSVDEAFKKLQKQFQHWKMID